MNVSNTPLSEHTKNLFTQIYKPLFEQYTNFYYNNLESKFVAQYNVIKDPTWPDCTAYSKFDKLPDSITESNIVSLSKEAVVVAVGPDKPLELPDTTQYLFLSPSEIK